MAAPSPKVSGAPYGYNAKIVQTDLGTLFCRAETITENVRINSRESVASQAKTFYPMWVASGAFTIRFVHRHSEERSVFTDWMRIYMERASSAQLTQNYLDISVPARRFQRRAVPRGSLVYGSDQATANQAKRTTMTFVGAADPQSRSEVSTMLHADNDLVSMFFYPAGIQTGWDTRERVYDQPPIRPGQPNRPV